MKVAWNLGFLQKWGSLDGRWYEGSYGQVIAFSAKWKKKYSVTSFFIVLKQGTCGTYYFRFQGGMGIVIFSKRDSAELEREVCGEKVEVGVEG